MTLKLKTGDLSVSIPCLTDESTFSNWDYLLRNYLGSSKLNKYIKYSVKPPFMLLPEATPFDRQAEVTTKVSYANILRVPVEIRTKIVEAEKAEIFTQGNLNAIPPELLELIIKSDLLVINDVDLYQIYRSTEDFVKGTAKIYQDKLKVKTLINASLSKSIQTIINEYDEVYDVYKHLRLKFKIDLKDELRILRGKFRKVKCRTLLKYITKYEQDKNIFF